MKFLQISPTKFAFALFIVFGFSVHEHKLNACENMQEIASELLSLEPSPLVEHYRALIEKIVGLFHEFVHDLQNNKKIDYYAKELSKLSKELGDTARNNHASNNASRHGNLHKRIFKLHKDLNSFIAIIESNKTAPMVISLKLMQKPELKNLIPEQAEWTVSNILAALEIRCKK